MCLDKLEDFKVKLNKNGVGEGYKTLYRRRKGFAGEYKGRGILRIANKWIHEGSLRSIKDKSCRVITSWNCKYPYGIHIWLTEYGACRWGGGIGNLVIKKVKFRNIVATGRQGKCRVVVAKEMYIMEE